MRFSNLGRIGTVCLLLIVAVVTFGVDTKPHVSANSPPGCAVVGISPADHGNALEDNCPTPSGGGFGVFSRVVADIDSIRKTVNAQIQLVSVHIDDLRTLVNRAVVATPVN